MSIPAENRYVLHKLSPLSRLHVLCQELNFAEWGKNMSLQQYLEREAALASTEHSKQALHGWVLLKATVDPKDATKDDILSSCETYSRISLLIHPRKAQEKLMVEMISTLTVASVFTAVHHRGNGYASQMMKMFRDRLPIESKLHAQSDFFQAKFDEMKVAFRECSDTVQVIPNNGDIVSSSLYSDIGPKFYSRLGWEVFPSLSLKCSEASDDPSLQLSVSDNLVTADIFDNEIGDMLSMDLVSTVRNMANLKFTEARFLMAPTKELLDWHIARSRYQYKIMGNPSPNIWGSVVTLKNSDTLKILGYALWMDLPLEKKMYILKIFVKEGGDVPPRSDITARLFSGVLKAAKDLKAQSVEYYGPTEDMGGYLADGSWKLVNREESLSSLSIRYSGDLSEGIPVEWVGNERYCWA